MKISYFHGPREQQNADLQINGQKKIVIYPVDIFFRWMPNGILNWLEQMTKLFNIYIKVFNWGDSFEDQTKNHKFPSKLERPINDEKL